MTTIQEVSNKIFVESGGFSHAKFSIIPYRQELSSLDPLEFIICHVGDAQLYFIKLMHATAFIWKDLSWEQWQKVLVKVKDNLQSLFNLSVFLIQFLEVDAIQALKDNSKFAAETISHFLISFPLPSSKPPPYKLAYLSRLNEMSIDFSKISMRLYQQGAPKAELAEPNIINI